MLGLIGGFVVGSTAGFKLGRKQGDDMLCACELLDELGTCNCDDDEYADDEEYGEEIEDDDDHTHEY